MAEIRPPQPDQFVFEFLALEEVDTFEDRGPHGTVNGPPKDESLHSAQWTALGVAHVALIGSAAALLALGATEYGNVVFEGRTLWRFWFSSKMPTSDR